jgi:hypothetical protein
LVAASRLTVALRCSSLTTSLGLRHTANKVTRMLCYMVGMHENCMLCKVSWMDGTHGWISAKDLSDGRNTKQYMEMSK